MPLYRRLSEQAAHANGHVIAVSAESVRTTEEYLREHGLRVDQIVSYHGKVQMTPVLLHVDRSGVIRNIWVGQQDRDGEARVLAVLRPAA
jgi:hypothetical protein